MDAVEFRTPEPADAKLTPLIFGSPGLKFGGGYGRPRYSATQQFPKNSAQIIALQEYGNKFDITPEIDQFDECKFLSCILQCKLDDCNNSTTVLKSTKKSRQREAEDNRSWQGSPGDD